jgi:hypothetical protein
MPPGYIAEEAMKLLIKIFFVCGMLAVLSLPAAAIDKSKKDEPSPDKKTVKVEKKKNDQPADSRDSQADKNQSSKDNYDNFIDRNNNGIDDRSEKAPSRSTRQKATPNPPPKKVSKP